MQGLELCEKFYCFAVAPLIANEDVFIWAEHYTKFKDIYKKKSHVQRNGVGDIII